MLFVAHGGHCCGMNHIYGLSDGPSRLLPEVPMGTIAFFKHWNSKVASGEVKTLPQHPLGGIYPNARPKETTLERMKAFIEWSKKNWRPSGIIEVVTAGSQDVDWRPELEKLGFKLVNQALNSNSLNTLYVYHLNTGQ
jgi:hypothetical protein